MPEPDETPSYDPSGVGDPDYEYLDDDIEFQWEMPPSPMERARFGFEEAVTRRRVAAAWDEGELMPEPPAARRDSGRSQRRTRQVNFRTTDDGYEELWRAAAMVDLSATGLAAALVRDGVRRILNQHRISAPRP